MQCRSLRHSTTQPVNRNDTFTACRLLQSGFAILMRITNRVETMKRVTTEFTETEKQSLKRVVFALAACSWKITDIAGVADTSADETYLKSEIERLETMISETAGNVSDGSIFWHRQIAVVQVLIDTHREELAVRNKQNP